MLMDDVGRWEVVPFFSCSKLTSFLYADPVNS